MEKTKDKELTLISEPAWCRYPDPTTPVMGCWSLLYGYVGSEDYCKNCTCHYLHPDQQPKKS